MRRVALLLLAAFAAAQAPDRDRRIFASWRPVDLPWEDLELADGLELGEGPRSLRDRFPYLVVSSAEDRKAKQAWMLTPQNLGRFLAKKAPPGGGAPAAIRGPAGALAAVHLFVPGPIVRTNEAAARVMAVARTLPVELGVKVETNPPAGLLPAAAAVLRADGAVAWNISFLALEMLGRMRLVHVKARVESSGAMEIETKAFVDGPQLSWQVGFTGEPTEAQLAAERRKRELADAALLKCARALELQPEVDTAWALGRVLRRMDQVKAILGAPDRDWGRDARMWQWELSPDETLTFAGKRTEDERQPIQHVSYLKSTRTGDVRATRGFVFYNGSRGR